MTRAVGCQREARRHDIGATLATGTVQGSGPRSARSVAVKVPRTPGIARAAAVSMRSIVACACGERTRLD